MPKSSWPPKSCAMNVFLSLYDCECTTFSVRVSMSYIHKNPLNVYTRNHSPPAEQLPPRGADPRPHREVRDGYHRAGPEPHPRRRVAETAVEHHRPGAVRGQARTEVAEVAEERSGQPRRSLRGGGHRHEGRGHRDD